MASQQFSQQFERVLMGFGDDCYQDFSRARFAEEREWYESALFYQRRQWLRWNDSTRRFTVIKQSSAQPRPMPVSNYFAMTINGNATQLDGSPVTMTVTPNDDSNENRRAAQAAERSLPAIDRESGFELLRPILAKHTVLWGMGITKDIFDSSAVNGRDRVPVTELQSTLMLSCANCGGTYDMGPQQQPAGNLPCPQCGSQTTYEYPKQALATREVMVFNRGKITTEVRPIFEIYLPRDCQNPNLAKTVLQRYRQPLSKLRRLYGDIADDLKADAPTDIHQTYLEALRSLINYNYLQEGQQQNCSLTEVWGDWDELTNKQQEKLTAELEADADTFQRWQDYGFYAVYAQDTMLDCGPNFLEGLKPYTFFQWEVDPANVYPKGLGSDTVPLQRRLNRLDSLMELGMMCNAAGKWLWPSTQTTKAPSGTPYEVVQYDPIGDGKIKPEFVNPEPFSMQAWQMRNAILTDFQRLGNTMGVSQGQMPSGGAKAFRAIAYLGAKADEQLDTQRNLWEMAHQLRYQKCLILARDYWDEPRRVKVAGYNGIFGMKQLMNKDLRGDYSLEFNADSSRPRTPEEKAQALGMLLQSGLVDPTDSATREYILNEVNLERLDLTDHLQYQKAERDLELLRTGGQLPAQLNPFLRADIFFRIFSDFTLTEEFEALDPQIQMTILQAALQYQAMQQQQPAQPGRQQQQAQIAQAMQQQQGQQQAPNPLSGVAGVTQPTELTEQGATDQASQLAQALP